MNEIRIANQDTLLEVKNLVENMGRGETGSVIKSVQRGTLLNNGESAQKQITISSVNPEKCIILINGLWHSSSTGTYTHPYLASLSATSITFNRTGYGAFSTAASFSWQVIEFV